MVEPSVEVYDGDGVAPVDPTTEPRMFLVTARNLIHIETQKQVATVVRSRIEALDRFVEYLCNFGLAGGFDLKSILVMADREIARDEVYGYSVGDWRIVVQPLLMARSL